MPIDIEKANEICRILGDEWDEKHDYQIDELIVEAFGKKLFPAVGDNPMRTRNDTSKGKMPLYPANYCGDIPTGMSLCPEGWEPNFTISKNDEGTRVLAWCQDLRPNDKIESSRMMVSSGHLIIDNWAIPPIAFCEARGICVARAICIAALRAHIFEATYS